MKSKTIDGYDIREWFRFGLQEVALNKKHINAINVFPVPDGDTGTNLTMTLKAMAERPVSTRSFSNMIERISESGLAHARGNSGIIFASYINGIAIEGKIHETVNLLEFSAAAHKAVDYAYKSIEKPVEGTMISVIRDWAFFLFSNHNKFEFFEDLLAEAYKTARISLDKTTEKLEILKKNKVVDAGGEGFVRFLKGINSTFNQEDMPIVEDEIYLEEILIDNNNHSPFRYCTEIFMKLAGEEPEAIRHKLNLLGDSLIIASSHNKTRVHLHTDHPEEMMFLLKEYGEILDQKVDDMRLQNQVLYSRNSDVAILTDSIADISDDLMMKYQIHCLPLTILIDDVQFLDKSTIDLHGLFNYISHAKAYPTSSQPEPIRVQEKLDYLLEHYKSIIIITVAEKLSGTFSVFKREADRLEKLGHRVTVIDSKLNSGAQGLLVKKAAELMESGCTHEKIVKEVLESIPKIKIYVCLETIENAIRGGRVPNTIGRLGIAIGARPIMTLEANGKGAAFGVGFSKKGITKKILKLIRKTKKEKGIQSYSIVHAENIGLAKVYEDFLTEITGKKPEFVTEISAITAIHTGPGSVAVSLMEL